LQAPYALRQARVDAYVERVNRIIAELEVSSLAAVGRQARAGPRGRADERRAAEAREVAEDLTGTALAEADHAPAVRRSKRRRWSRRHGCRHISIAGGEEQADEILDGARAEAAKTLEDGEEKAAAAEQEAEKRLRALREEIEAAEEARVRLLDELRRTAAELEDLAGAMVDRGPAESSDSPTEKIPKSADGRRSRGDAPTEAHTAGR